MNFACTPPTPHTSLQVSSSALKSYFLTGVAVKHFPSQKEEHHIALACIWKLHVSLRQGNFFNPSADHKFIFQWQNASKLGLTKIGFWLTLTEKGLDKPLVYTHESQFIYRGLKSIDLGVMPFHAAHAQIESCSHDLSKKFVRVCVCVKPNQPSNTIAE